MKREVIIVGGGVAGIQTALRLADRGIRPTIVEKEPDLGGKLPGMVSSVPVADACVRGAFRVASPTGGTRCRSDDFRPKRCRIIPGSVTLADEPHPGDAARWSFAPASRFSMPGSRRNTATGSTTTSSLRSTSSGCSTKGRVATAQRSAVRVGSPCCTAWDRATRRCARRIARGCAASRV